MPPWYLYPAPAADYPSAAALYNVTVTFLWANGSVAMPETPTFTYFNSMDHRLQYPGVIDAVPGRSVSWTGFAFDPTLLTATVSVYTSFDITGGCVLRPRSYGLTCDAPAGGRAARFNLTTAPQKVAVELLGDGAGNTEALVKQPLFVFPDPPEDPALIPQKGAPGVLWYDPGVYNFSMGQLPLGCDVQHVYVSPGAVINGGFITTCNSGSVTLSGRGMLCGTEYPWHSPQFKWALLNIDSGSYNVVDGLMLVDSPEFYMASYGAYGAVIRNVKMLGSWPYNSDGFDIGRNALIEDCFVKSNDDSIKLAGGSDAVAQRLVVWQMLNGAVIQLGWNSGLTASNVTVRDVDVVHVGYCSENAAQCSSSDNNGILDSDPQGVQSYSITGITLENIRVEGDAVRMLTVQVGTGNATGSWSGLTLRNVSADAVSLPRGMTSNLLLTQQQGAGGDTVTLSNVQFVGVSVNGTCWSSAGVGQLLVQGNVSNVTFTC